MLKKAGFVSPSFIAVLLLLAACAQRGPLPDPAPPAAAYSRKDWPHWASYKCRNTRTQVLIERSLGSVTFKNAKRCRVTAGVWADFYYPETLTQASAVQIDHLVPLKNAHMTGGAGWSRERKKAFANDPENLVITSAKANVTKGANDLSSWLPSKLSYACRYWRRWMQVKKKYALTITPAEANAIDARKCEGPDGKDPSSPSSN